jgi:thiol-disulfide isomerase/thioredoxin
MTIAICSGSTPTFISVSKPRALHAWVLAGASLLSVWAPAQAAPATAATSAAQTSGFKRPAVGGNFFLAGNTLEGTGFNTAELRGKVVLVYYWHTGCAVCLDKMPELRANAAGWASKPFEMVIVNADKERSAAASYWRTVKQLRSGEAIGPVIWRGDADFIDSLGSEPAQWPVSILLDRKGKVAGYWEGRMPAEAWDNIADLMP